MHCVTGGGSYSDKRYSDSSYSDRRYSDKCYSDKYACSETYWSAHLCRKLHSLFYAEFGAEFTSLSSTSLAVLVFVYWLFSYNWTENCIINWLLSSKYTNSGVFTTGSLWPSGHAPLNSNKSSSVYYLKKKLTTATCDKNKEWIAVQKVIHSIWLV